MVAKQEHVCIIQDIKCTSKIQWYAIVMLSLAVLGIVISIILNTRKLKLFRGHLFSNTVKRMLSISGLCRTAGSIHLFKIIGKLTPEHIYLKRNILWDVIELNWKIVNMTLNGNKRYTSISHYTT